MDEKSEQSSYYRISNLVLYQYFLLFSLVLNILAWDAASTCTVTHLDDTCCLRYATDMSNFVCVSLCSYGQVSFAWGH